ncbi:hypothetical protein AB0I84_27875 [Streptomyces spectabilis]|uniref:hypothetical protein n=1 Tax=Streptomyces spectabilis TaxID=68270 RepID=UPI0033D1CD25
MTTAGASARWTPTTRPESGRGYFAVRRAADDARHEAWLASLSPQQRADYEAECRAEYETQLADEVYDYDDPWRYRDLGDEEPEDPQAVYGDSYDDYGYGDEAEAWDGDDR